MNPPRWNKASVAGRVAFYDGALPADCPRRRKRERADWLAGYEEERAWVERMIRESQAPFPPLQSIRELLKQFIERQKQNHREAALHAWASRLDA